MNTKLLSYSCEVNHDCDDAKVLLNLALGFNSLEEATLFLLAFTQTKLPEAKQTHKAEQAHKTEKAETHKTELLKTEAPKPEAVKVEAPKTEAKVAVPKLPPVKVEPVKVETKAEAKPETPKPAVKKTVPAPIKVEADPEEELEVEEVPTQFGTAHVRPNTSGGFVSMFVDGAHKGLVASGADADEAIGNLLDLAEAPAPKPEPAPVQKAVRTRVAPARAEAPAPIKIEAEEPAPASAAPKAKNGSAQATQIPVELATAQTFRHVMAWMVQNVGFDPAEILAKCEELRPHVAVIDRVGGDLTERIARGLLVFKKNPVAAAQA